MEDQDVSDPSHKIDMEERFKELIEQLAALAPAEDITDTDIDREVEAVRSSARLACLEPGGRGDS